MAAAAQSDDGVWVRDCQVDIGDDCIGSEDNISDFDDDISDGWSAARTATTLSLMMACAGAGRAASAVSVAV